MLQLIPLGACAHLFILSDGGEWLLPFFLHLQERPHGRSRHCECRPTSTFPSG
jgi:hypothetical protein